MVSIFLYEWLHLEKAEGLRQHSFTIFAELKKKL